MKMGFIMKLYTLEYCYTVLQKQLKVTTVVDSLACIGLAAFEFCIKTSFTSSGITLYVNGAPKSSC
jgi:uncharacterized YccA/Bax inhibitor family protein